jgi:hypothetical protein
MATRINIPMADMVDNKLTIRTAVGDIFTPKN